MKKFLIITTGLGMLFLMWCQKTTITTNPFQSEEITGANEEITGSIEEITGSIEEITGFLIQSFEECISAGFPIMESYPRQCNDWTTTYVEEITVSQTLTGEKTNETEQIENKEEVSTWTNLSQLQEKLKAMMERRNQQTVSNTWTNSWTTSNTIWTTGATNEVVTEQDIENLENIIDTIIKK